MSRSISYPESGDRPSRLWLLPIFALLAAGLVCLALFFRSWYEYRQDTAYYTSLAEQVSYQATPETAAAAPASSVDFAALEAENPAVAAWLEAPGIGVSLPVVQASDNATYLHTGFNGAANTNGCLFFAASASGSDLYRVIYGHNIHTGAMFGKLPNYRSADFYAENPTFTLCTPQGDRTCVIFSCHMAEDGEDLYTVDRTAGADYDAFLAELQAASLYDTGVEVPSGAQVVTLSTCSSSYGSGTRRFVVHAFLE